MKKDNKIVDLPLALIEPDENQPRRNFDVEKLSSLKKSITKHGIMNPLIVEKRGSSYLLVDGERRYRASKELGLKLVPVTIVEEQSDTDRLVQQFHIQEQHEGWGATEKANAVGRLADALDLTIKQVAELLNLPEKTMGTYIAFSKLLAKKEFEKNNVSIDLAHKIVALRTFVKRYFSKNVEGEEFDKDDEYALEMAVIARIKDGSLTNRNDILKIHDAVRIDPQSIRKFIKDSKMTIEKLYKGTGANVAQHYRRIVDISPNIVSQWNKLKATPKDVLSMFEADPQGTMHLSSLRNAKRALEEMLDVIE